ncbi:MAG: NADPH-dependent F420 reductase [Acidimicrobiales bacterium]
MQVGIVGGTGPAGRGLAVRAAASGHPVVIGSRDEGRARGVAAAVVAAWPDRHIEVEGRTNEQAAGCEVVVVATPWDGTVAALHPLAEMLDGKILVSMVSALLAEGREFHALLPPRGSMAASIQAAVPGSMVAAAFHHLPASEMEQLDRPLIADVLVASDHAEATRSTLDLVDSIEGLRGIDAGSLSQAGPIEALTATLITVNRRHRVHAAVRLAGYDTRGEHGG